MTNDEAFRELGVSDSANADEIKAAYRARALVTHPDRAGNADAFARVQIAYLTLRESEYARQAKREKCQACGGTGRQAWQRGCCTVT